MIVVDTSALIAILFKEPEGPAFEKAIFDDGRAGIGTPTIFEFMMVARREVRDAVEAEATALLQMPGLISIPWTRAHADEAFQAFLRFGKGRHPAALNFGDCMSYAVAKALDCPLLYKGGDFAKTDIASAV